MYLRDTIHYPRHMFQVDHTLNLVLDDMGMRLDEQYMSQGHSRILCDIMVDK